LWDGDTLEISQVHDLEALCAQDRNFRLEEHEIKRFRGQEEVPIDTEPFRSAATKEGSTERSWSLRLFSNLANDRLEHSEDAVESFLFHVNDERTTV